MEGPNSQPEQVTRRASNFQRERAGKAKTQPLGSQSPGPRGPPGKGPGSSGVCDCEMVRVTLWGDSQLSPASSHLEMRNIFSIK